MNPNPILEKEVDVLAMDEEGFTPLVSFLRKEPLKTRHVQHLLTMILKCKDRRVTLLLTTFNFINLFKAHSTPRSLKL